MGKNWKFSPRVLGKQCEVLSRRGTRFHTDFNLHLCCVDNRLQEGQGRRDIDQNVTSVVQAKMLAAWTRVVAARSRKEFEVFVKRRIDRT